MANEFKFQPTQIADAVQRKLVIKRLPEWMQNLEQIQMFCDDVIQQWFNPADQEIVDGYIGDRGSPAAAGKIFLHESDEQRKEYQFSTAYVSRNTDNSVRSMQFYPDLVGYLGHYGALTDNQTRLLSGKFYSWTPPINPNKMQNYSSYLWDSENEYNITSPDYVVMQRNAENGNLWSLQNFWYTIGQTLPDGTMLTEQMSQNSVRWKRAQAPIIEFNKDIEMLNYGTNFRGVVDYMSDTITPEDIVQKSVSNNIRVDGFNIKAGDRILFTSLGNPGENNRIYKIYTKRMEDGSRVYGVTLDEDEQNKDRITGEPHRGDNILIRSGNVYGNKMVYWDGARWALTQAKPTVNSFPQFQLYDKNGIKLNDPAVYSQSSFHGSSLFGLKINFNYGLDKVYGKHVELSNFNYYVFENFIQSERFDYLKSGIRQEIPGLYFYNVTTGGTMNLHSDWVRSKEESKQYVRQVPSIDKTSMYRVFTSLYDLNSFQQPLEFMYAYVMENDSYYQYYQAPNATFMTWHKTNNEAIQSDLYNHSFELAQKITPNTSDELIVYVDGEVVRDYEKVLDANGRVDHIVISPDVKLGENTILEIKTYSKTTVPDLSLGAYEIPINLKNNPYNEFIEYIHQGEYTPHFTDIIAQNITRGTVNDLNDYEMRLELGLVDNSVGTKIIQNETSLLPLMLHTANENLDIFAAIMFVQNEYFRFINKFNRQMMMYYEDNRSEFDINSASIIVDALLSKINVGKDSSFPFFYDGMGSSTNTNQTYIPPTPAFLGITKVKRPEKATYVYAGRDLSCYNVDHMGNLSKSYKVLNGVDKMDDIIFELENRIYNSLDNKFKSVDFQPDMDENTLRPTPYYGKTEYTAQEYNTLTLRGYVNFIATNGISNSTHDYDQTNWMTWNYTGTQYLINGVRSDIMARGSWRAIYTDSYGTYRPATNPWEMFGFGQRPDWFNQEYEPTKVRLGHDVNDFIYVYEAYVKNQNGDIVPSGLWDTVGELGDASKGVILGGARRGQYDMYKRCGKQPFKLTKTGEMTTDGEEIVKYELIEPIELGLVYGSLDHLAEPWSYGDMGDMEFTYMNTVMFEFDRVMALLRAKPAQFANYFYDTLSSTVKDIANDGKQFLYNDTNKRLNFDKNTKVSTENGTRILGYQTWVSDYLIYQNKDVTKNYGDVLRSSGVNVGHRIGGFTKEDQVSFTSDVFGKISSENQHIGLVRSSSFRDEALSAIKIQWTGNGYAISGYDLVGASFKFKVPNRRGRRQSIEIGRRSVVHYNEYLDGYAELEYGSLLKTFQEVYTFICGYGEYLKERGWIFEDQDENGVIQDWTVIAKDYVEWSSTNLAIGDFISVSPSTKNAKFGSLFGSVLSVTQFSGGVWSLLDDQNMGIRPFEINTSRIGNVFTVRVQDDVEKRMGLIRVSLVAFEHAIIFDNSTIFGNNIYIPRFGSIQEMLRMYGYITGNWNGRLEANGFIILEKGTLPSFEKLVDDFQSYYDINNPVDNTTIRNLSKHLIGFQTRDYLSRMISNETTQTEFYQGFIRDKGTNQVLDKVLRVSKTYKTDEYKTLQEWAFKVGEYGDVYGKKHLQFILSNSELQQQPQMFTFYESATHDSKENNIVYFGTQGVDPRWITRPEDDFKFPMRVGKSDKIHLPDIGPVNLTEVSLSTLEFATAYADRVGYLNKTGTAATSVWMFRDQQQNWNIFDLVNTGIFLEKITPIAADEDEELAGRYCTLTFSAPHGLTDGEYYFLKDTSEYMPDSLRSEAIYFTSSTDPKSIVVSLDLINEYTFSTDKPELVKYVSRFPTQASKDAYVSKKYSFESPESTLFIRPSTYNIQTNVTELFINLFDPINGVIPGTIVEDITFTTPADPARYNSDDQSIIAWGSEMVGKVWWDTTNAFFLDYNIPVLDSNGNVLSYETLNYKRVNWGKLLPHSRIDIYEWVASPVLPYEWDKYCVRQSTLNKKDSSWTPSGEALNDQYSEFKEYDESTQAYKTVYYFWVKNTIYVPPVKGRSKPSFEIARMIANPLLLNVPWMSPISENSFIISGIQHEITDDKSVLSVTYQNDPTEVVKHEQYQLCQEGLDYNFNPAIWNCLWNSMRSQAILPNGTVQQLRYPFNELGFGPNKTMIKNPIEARRTFVDSANAIYRTINITTDQVIMNDVFNVKTTESNPNMVSFRVIAYNNELVISPTENKFIENDAVLVSSSGTLPSPLNSTNVYFVHFDSNGYIRLMNSPSTGTSANTINLLDRGEGKLGMIKQADYVESLGTSLDMTQYWNLADWYSKGYSADTIYTEEESTESADQKNYQEGDVIRVIDSAGIWTLYVKKLSRNVIIWEAVGRQNSTVALNSQLYSGYVQYNDDGTLTNVEKNVRQALMLLQKTFNFVQSRLVFDMIKYIHTEQNIVDWVFKTSYIYIMGLDQSLQKSYITNDNLINQIVDYFEEVKPYRTKIRSQIEQKTSDEDEIIGLMNDLDPNGYILVNGVWIKTQKDIWDYEKAVYNTVTGKWEIEGSLPSDFETPNRRFQEQYDILYFDNVQCTPDSGLASADTLERVNKKYQTNQNDLINDNTAYKLQRYSYSHPVINTTPIEAAIITSLSAIYPTMDVNLPLKDGIKQLYQSFMNDVAKSNQLNEDIATVTANAYASSSDFVEMNQYVQYNTLANRLKAYTGKDDDTISQEVGCPFKGKRISDNPNTRLPIGYGASNGENYGYVMNSKFVYDKFVNIVKEANPSFTKEQINEELQQEYGLYSWKYDMAEQGRFYQDALYVLTAMRNTYNPDASDTFEIARQILDNPTIGLYCMVMIPRKYVYVIDLNTGATVPVPRNISISQFMEDEYNNTGAMLTLAEINLDDLPLDKNNLLYNDFKEILSGINEAKYFDDMNAFDNLGFESQTKNVIYHTDGTATSNNDSVFLDISDINPTGKMVSQMRFTAIGYNYDTTGNAQLRDQGNFNVEGYAVLNPYKRTEVLVSIPRYEDSVKLMDKSILTHEEIQYSYHVKDVVSTSGVVRLRGVNDFKVGEKVAVFTAEAADLDVQTVSYNYVTVLKVDNIKENDRPKIFTVSAVSGDSITIDGLTFESTYDSSDSQYLTRDIPLSLNVVRVTSFADAEFTAGGIVRYTQDRTYRVNVLDYDVFYDRELIGGSFANQTMNDYESWYCTTETGIDLNGNEVDHGYPMPIYGKGSLSELVRTSMADSVQFYVYEYDVNAIKPVKSGNSWTYTGTLVDNVYISSSNAKLTVLFKAQREGTEYLSIPKSVSTFAILDGKVDSTDGEVILVDGELIGVRRGYMVRAEHYSVERNYENGTSYSKVGLDLGKEKDMETYSTNYPTIPHTKFSNGLSVTGAEIASLIK